MDFDLKISGSSTARFSTFWMVEPLGLLFDCGDGTILSLKQKTESIKTVAFSHADRDHLGGLFSLLELHRPNQIIYPGGSSSFSKIRTFMEEFSVNKSESKINWKALTSGEEIRIRNSLALESYKNYHIPHPEGTEASADKTLSYSLMRTKQKLRDEFKGKPGAEIAKLRETMGDKAVLCTEKSNLLTYSGDTPIESPDFWQDPEILIHEATFLDREMAEAKYQIARHAVLDDVLKMAGEIPSLRALILGHFSNRYSPDDIASAIQKGAGKYGLGFPVFAVFPGEFTEDILSTKPVFE